jgi:hypothetical protein
LHEPHANWIGGEWRAAGRGKSYGLCAFGGAASTRWPRSDGDDLALALAAAGEGGAAWRSWTRAERVELLEDALATDLFLGDPQGQLAGRLGAGAWEIEEWVQEARRRGAQVLRRRGEPRRLGPASPPLTTSAPSPAASPALSHGPRLPGPPTTALLRVHGAALFSGLVQRLWPLLLEGWAVILIADPALPMLARELALALDHADLPPGALSLLCDDGASALRAGLLAQGIGLAHLLELGERRAEVLELAARPRGERGARGGQGDRGRGAPPGPGPEVHFESLAGSTRVVLAGDDPERAARASALGALGRVQALSGQREGQAGRVVVHRRHFSRFTQALLAELDHLAREAAGPLALLDPELPRYVERLRRLGLDEGATLLRGDSGTWFGPAGAAGSHARGRDVTLDPLVFTNVEPRMRLARAQRPAPLLRLLRAEDDEAALLCAEELDLAP